MSFLRLPRFSVSCNFHRRSLEYIKLADSPGNAQCRGLQHNLKFPGISQDKNAAASLEDWPGRKEN